MSTVGAWFDGPLGGRLLGFNLLPSRSLDPVRWPRFADGMTPALALAAGFDEAGLHRQVSRRILDELDLDPCAVVDLALPELPLALLEGPSLARFCQTLGALLCGRIFQTAIRGEQVRSLWAHPRHEALRVARDWTRSPPPDYAGSSAWDLSQALSRFEALGAAAWLHACAGAGTEVAARMVLKMPPVQEVGGLPDPDALLALGFDILREQDPTWISWFPSTH